MDLNQLPKHIFGLHDAGGEQLFTDAGKRGWIVVTVQASDTLRDFTALSNAGHGVLVRLNNGYGSAGTIPFASQYDAFANACANYVAGSNGAHIWIIGNETNLSSERPGNGSPQVEVITPQRYGECFAKCRAAIKNVAGHADDWVIPSPPGPWNPETTYDGNPVGDWVSYFRDILTECVKRGATPDALALHTYTAHDVPMDAGLIESEEKMQPPLQERHWQFRAYRDFLGVVPNPLRNLPVFITESQHLPWENRDTGWIQRAFAEINAWNANGSNQPIQALCLFRWQVTPDAPGWSISDRGALIQDFRAAIQNEYPVRWAIKVAPPAPAKPPVVPPPAKTVLRLAQVRSQVQDAINKLEAGDGAGAHAILDKIVTPWFYETTKENSTDLENAKAHTTARWFCEEATRNIEDKKLTRARDILRDEVLSWLNSAGPSHIGILGIPEPAKKKAAPKKPTAKRKPTTHKKNPMTKPKRK